MMTEVTSKSLVEIENLKMHFPIASGFLGRKVKYLKAVDGVDLIIKRGETFGLVGESGCGKSTLARTLIRLYEPTSGKMLFDGVDITAFSEKQMMSVRRRMQMIFQDPYASLNGRMTVRDLIAEPMEIVKQGDRESRTAHVHELLERVGLNADHATRFAHEFSGGQRQRIGIARAIALSPDLVICDEPISALDVSIQAQVVNMLEDLQAEMGLTFLFITHDLSMVRHISDRIGVMYLGKIVELGTNDRLYESPKHPYTQALLSAIPIADPAAAGARQTGEMMGEVPSPVDMPSGCRFRTRCPLAAKRCATEEPQLRETETGHFTACHFAGP